MTKETIVTKVFAISKYDKAYVRGKIIDRIISNVIMMILLFVLLLPCEIIIITLNLIYTH
jgi:hypothetical protein